MLFKLQDFFLFTPTAGRSGSPSSDPNIREIAKSKKGLKVTFVASHAGMVNGNHVMYSPSGMKDACYTWVWPQRRPIQVHHDDQADPIGRIINARYSYYGEPNTSNLESDALKIFSDSIKITKDNIVDIAKTLEDANILNQKDWRGVGELILEGIVTDSDAIEKILDGRYQGVSITQFPKQAFCSICGQDWIADGPCEHSRGIKDEESGRTMYLVVGDTEYGEASYVNNPADKFCKSTDVYLLDHVNQSDDNSGLFDKALQTTISFQFIDALDKETKMLESETIVDSQEQDTLIEALGDEPNSNDKQSVEGDSNDSNKEAQPSDQETSTEDTEQDPRVTIEEALACLFEDRDNLTGFMCDVLFDAMEDLVEEDKRLSTKKRQSLPASSFCGPNRSFPVNDCDHYIAAKRLIGRYQGQGNKSEILSCINKKGKALGCDSDKQNDSYDKKLYLEELRDEQLIYALYDLEELMIKRGLKAEHKCDKCSELSAQISDFEKFIPKLKDTLEILRTEYKTVVSEHMASENAHAVTLDNLQEILCNFALTTLLLIDKETSEEDLRTKVNAMTIEDLNEIIIKSDISQVISFVRSGLSREPEITITQNEAEYETVVASDITTKLSESLVKFQADYGTSYAVTCLRDWIRAGKLPKDFTLDKAFEIVAK